MVGSVVADTDPPVDGARARRSRVLLVEAQDLVRVGLAAVIDDAVELELDDACTRPDEALDRVADGDRPDVALVGARVDGTSGTELCARIRERSPTTQVAIVGRPGEPVDPELAEDARAAGAGALVLPCVHTDELVDALDALGRGGAPRSWVVGCPAAPLHWEDERWREARLTPQEQRVMGLLTDSLTNRQIADALGLGEATVKNYVRSVLTKLGFERRTQAVVYGVHLRAHGWEPAVHHIGRPEEP
jgi:DNA-binding NarL/FixJ family response regulator